jgi:hypothetical protein
MFHKLKSVSALPDYRLLVTFQDGTSKEYDCTPLLREQPFQPLADTPGLFQQVTVDVGGYGICWNEDIDLDCNELYINGAPLRTPFTELMSFADAAVIWGVDESTLRKAVSYRRFTEGSDVQKFGKQWVITRTAMVREYGQPRYS